MHLPLLTLIVSSLFGQAPPPTHADVSYGPHERNKLDLWIAASDKPTPLVIFIHGGGFVSGDKNKANAGLIKRALASGVSFAAINYRYRTQVPIQTVLRDSARAVQYLRYKSGEYKLDKQRFAAFGGSAGAGTSLWLAFHDDLADPQNSDPVLRESTRLTAAASTAGQATYDIVQWPEFLGKGILQFADEKDWPAFYGLKTKEDLYSPEGRRIRADVDMLGLISKEDPPVYLAASSAHDGLRNRGDVNHTSKHSLEVKKKCDALGVKAMVRIAGDGAKENDGGHLAFLLKQLGAQPR